MHATSRLFLIDGSSQMYRAYHAIRGLTGPDGRSTNAVYGFVTMLRKLIADHRPELIAAAFDLAGPTFRDQIAADYKANRTPMPGDLAEQIPLVHDACEALGVPILTHHEFEADDVIGTIARRAAAAGMDVAIVTGDKDFFQLVDERVKVYNPRDEGTWYNEDGVRERWGVAPSQVVDVLSLMGDSIDNIKGVPGIGEKGARDLIAAHGTLEALLTSAASLPQKKYREALLQHADSARQARELVTIRTDVPLEFDVEDFRYRGADRARCFDLFSRLGFRSLITEFAPTAATVAKDYELVDTPAALAALEAALRASGAFALHVVAERGAVAGAAFSPAARVASYVPAPQRARSQPAGGDLFSGRIEDSGPEGLMQAAGDAGSTEGGALRHLQVLFEDPAVPKAVHDVKSATLSLATVGIELAGAVDDTMLASYVLDATRPGHGIELLALERVSYRAITFEDLRGKGARAVSLADLPSAAVRDYACERADLTGQLTGPLVQDLEREGLLEVYHSLELPLVPVLVDVERAGIKVDLPVLSAMSRRVEAELDERSRRIFALAGVEFNINSPKQLSDVLFDKLELPITKKTGKTRTASTAVEVLEELAAVHELPREILEWRAVQKLKGTYIDALPLLVHPRTGRVHTSFNQAVAATGRLSSSDPNLQNIPIRTELGRQIRRAFVAEPGSVLVSADYSQIELRVLAHLSGDESLVEAFRRNEDVHDRTALKVFGRDSRLDKYELRRRAKIINYALLYGKTAFTLAKDIGVSQQAAQEFIDAYFAGYPGVRRFIDATLTRARETGTVRTLFGRRRLVPEITSRNGQVRAAAERVAVNMPIQGTAADILKLAMIDLHARLASRFGRGSPDARMILTVHDELVFEVRRELTEEVTALVRERMAAATTLTVPLDVDVGVGPNWMEAKG